MLNMWRCKYIVLASVVLLLPALSFARLQGGAISDQTATAAIKDAPDCPADSRLPVGAKLLDFIDCAAEPVRSFADDDRSGVINTAAGDYRQTDINDGSFFAYRFAVGKINAPHVLVVEYPDDDERTASIFIHESGMRGIYNSDFHVEGGYSTGAEYPNTGKMLQQIIYYWPEEQSPAIVCLNLHHLRSAAMARVWVYEITEDLKPAKINLPDKKYPQRQIGIFFEDSRMFRFNFGRAGDGYEHCARYLKHTGQNLLSFDSMLYSYPKCEIPSLRKGNDDTLKALEICDKYDLGFLAVFDPTSGAKVGGVETGNLSDNTAVNAWVTAISEFIDTYGKHESLKGISFGGPAGANRFRSPKLPELQAKINTVIAKSKRSDIAQHIFFGYHFLHRFMFLNENFQPRDIVKKWQDTALDGESFSNVLAGFVDKYYKSIFLDVSDYAALNNAVIHRSFYVNDHRCFRFYPLRTPLWMIFRDFNFTPQVARLLDGDKTAGACMFGNYFEIVTGMFKDKNFWWDRTWIAPQINPATPYFGEVYANSLANGDATIMLNSSWVNPIIGSPDLVRDFAVAFRTLPAIKFDTAFVSNHVVTRQLNIDGDLWFYLLNNHNTDAVALVEFPTESGEILNLVSGNNIGRHSTVKIPLKPYELACFRIDNYEYELLNSSTIRARGSYAALAKRIEDFDKSIRTLQQAGVGVEPAYLELRKQVADVFRAGRYEMADKLLGFTLANELKLRVDMLNRDMIEAKRFNKAIKIDGIMDEWDSASFVEINASENLVCDHWLFNNWTGEADLSAKVWAGWDDENLYIAFDVKDNVYQQKDAINFILDTENYASTMSAEKPQMAINVPAPGDKAKLISSERAVLQADGGYCGELAIPLEKLGIAAGSEFGIGIVLRDMDMTAQQLKDLKIRRSWRLEKSMEWPVNSNYLSGRQPQSCGIIRLVE